MLFWLSLIAIGTAIGFYITAITVMKLKWVIAASILLILGVGGWIIAASTPILTTTETTKNDLIQLPENEYRMNLDTDVSSSAADLIYMQEVEDGEAEPQRISTNSDIKLRLSDKDRTSYVQVKESTYSNGWLVPWTNIEKEYTFYITQDDLSIDTLEYLSK